MSVKILTETQAICWTIYRPIYQETCWLTYQTTIGQHFASMVVDTRSIWWSLNVGGISVNCRWNIDQLLHNTMCFRLFFKASSVLETSSTEMNKFYWNEQTSVRQLSRTWSDIWVLFRRMFTFEQMVWHMGKFLNSCWWVGVFDAFSSASWWGIWPSKLPTYPEIWLKFFKKSNAWRFAPGGAWDVLESVSTKYRLQTAADHCFHHTIRTRQQ